MIYGLRNSIVFCIKSKRPVMEWTDVMFRAIRIVNMCNVTFRDWRATDMHVVVDIPCGSALQRAAHRGVGGDDVTHAHPYSS